MCIRDSGNDAPGNAFSACRERAVHCVFKPAAAGHLHAHDRYALYVVFRDDGSQLFRVVNAVKLRAAYKRYPSAYEVIVKVQMCIRDRRS